MFFYCKNNFCPIRSPRTRLRPVCEFCNEVTSTSHYADDQVDIPQFTMDLDKRQCFNCTAPLHPGDDVSYCRACSRLKSDVGYSPLAARDATMTHQPAYCAKCSAPFDKGIAERCGHGHLCIPCYQKLLTFKPGMLAPAPKPTPSVGYMSPNKQTDNEYICSNCTFNAKCASSLSKHRQFLVCALERRCPKCPWDLAYDEKTNTTYCTNRACTFSVEGFGVT